jgi:DNA helicase-2/ATP-dependent DNA helicase PcrA
MSVLNGLNEEQRKVVLQNEGPSMVLAGAGSGKTKTLVAKISYLLQELDVSPFRVLALTFSNKAAREMRERVASQSSCDLGALQITTFHSYCARLLRTEAQYLGLSKNFTIYDTSESKAIVKGILSRRGISLKEVNPNDVLYYIDDIKNQGFYEGKENFMFEPEFDEDLDYYDYFLEYEHELHRANAVDFGGLITGVLKLFEKFPEVLERVQARYEYILIDEYQDTNRAQFELITKLVGGKKNVCVVGDEDQSIYSWRGADIRNILDFETMFEGARLFKLERNYRSTKNIIEAAGFVISRNVHRKGKSMWTENPTGESIKVVECGSEKDESSFVANEILSLKDEGMRLDEMAVFYRSNSQSRVIEDALRKAQIPYRVVGGVKFYDRKEIKDILGYVRLVVNDKDSLALSRIINVPARGIGATTLRKLEEAAVQKSQSLWETIEQVVDHPEEFKSIRITAKVKAALRDFVSLITEVRVLESNSAKPSELYEKLLQESGYFDFLRARKDYESIARMENLEELGNAIIQYEEQTPNPSLTNFLESITLDNNVAEETDVGEVSLMTIHGAKGLEFDVVFVTGAEENIFPSYLSIDDGDMGIEEERRLFYVAMTRAMKKLYLSFAQGRMLFGQLKFNGPSRFINEIPEKYYLWVKAGATNRSSYNDEDEFEFSQESHDYDDPVIVTKQQTRAETLVRSKFSKGEEVVHSLYGKGKVLKSEGFGMDEKVVVKFSDGEQKKFMVKFAPLVSV